jgi:hypothetical protein
MIDRLINEQFVQNLDSHMRTRRSAASTNTNVATSASASTHTYVATSTNVATSASTSTNANIAASTNVATLASTSTSTIIAASTNVATSASTSTNTNVAASTNVATSAPATHNTTQELDNDDPNEAEEDYDPETLIREFLQEATDGDHLRTTTLYLQQKSELIGKEVTVTSGSDEMTWKIIDDLVPVDSNADTEHDGLGICGFDFNKDVVITDGHRHKKRTNLLTLFIYLWPGDWRKQLQRLNVRIRIDNDMRRSGRYRVQIQQTKSSVLPCDKKCRTHATRS